MKLRCILTHVGASLFHPSISFSHPPLPPLTFLFLEYLLSTKCMRSLQEQPGMQKECRAWILLCAAPTGWERVKNAGPPLTTGGQWHLGKQLSRQIQAVKSGLDEQGVLLLWAEVAGAGSWDLGSGSLRNSMQAGAVQEGQVSPGQGQSLMLSSLGGSLACLKVSGLCIQT